MQKYLILILLFIFCFANSLFLQPSENVRIINEQTAKFKEILDIATQNYVDSVDIKKITEAAFSAMLKELDDYSNYLSAEQYKRISEINKGKSIGFGINVVQIEDSIIVANVVKNSSADSNGIVIGDKIIFIDDIKTTGKSIQEINSLFSGPKGSQSKFIIKKNIDDEIKELLLYRNDCQIKSVYSSFIIPETDIAYIKISSFSNESAVEIKDVINKLIQTGAKNLLFDLRSNNGGYLEKVLELLALFFKKDDLLVYTEARNNNYSMKKEVEKEGEFTEIPVIVLTDNHTASAAEIFAGAMQDNDRGIIIGELTFGKGLAQKMWEFKDGSAFALTIARYFTPSGRTVQKNVQNTQNLIFDDSIGLDKEKIKVYEDIYKRIGNQKSLPIFKSKKGRDIVGGGGIIPDVVVFNDSLTMLTQVLKSRSIFFEFALLFLKYNGEEIRLKSSNDFLNFAKYFIVDDNLLSKFREFCKMKNIWNEQMFLTDKDYIINFIKAVISNVLWGDDGFFSASISNDNQVLKAISLFKDAKELLELK